MKHEKKQNNQESELKDKPKNKFSKNSISIIIATILVVGVVVFLKLQTKPINSFSIPESQAINYSGLIDVHTKQANRRNLNAFKQFEMKLNLALDKFNKKLDYTTDKASKKASSYKSACATVYYLAYDKIKNTNTTENFLQEKIRPITNPIVKELTDDINISIEKLNYELRSNTMILAKDLASLGPNKLKNNYTVNDDKMKQADFQEALRNFGFNVSSISVFAPFDIWVLFKTQFGKTIWKKIAGTAARLFARQAVEATAVVSAPVIDGPLPFGDIIAIGGAIWTAYDVYSSRKDFEKELNLSIKNILNKIQYNAHKQAIDHANGLIKQYQKFQDEMGTEIINQLTQKKYLK